MKNITLITLFVGASAFITSAYAELSGNLGVTSDYFWRGTTQSGGEASVSGGLDYATEDYYVGAWIGSLGEGGGEELDLYIGTEISGFDVGLIKYIIGGAEATEYYVGYSFAGADLSYAVDADTDDEFIGVSYGVDLIEGLGTTISYGDYDATGEYLQLDVSYGDLTISVVDHDAAADLDYVVSYGWSL